VSRALLLWSVLAQVVAAAASFALGSGVRPALLSTARLHPASSVMMRFKAEKGTKVPIPFLSPAPSLAPRDVIDAVMASLHRTNWDDPTEYYGFEVALGFLAPGHNAILRKAKPSGFARFLRQPHKVAQIAWNEYRFEGELVELTDDDGRLEVYQMVSMRANPDDEWSSVRWHLVKTTIDWGEVSRGVWLVENVFTDEPDTPEDVEFLRSHAPAAGAANAMELDSPRTVVDRVMKALRHMDEPYPLHGAAVATRYCSPRNRASELSPAVFAGYLEDEWYAILKEWDVMDDDSAEEDEDELWTGEVECSVRREEEDSFTLVSWRLSQYDGRWLIDSLNII